MRADALISQLQKVRQRGPGQWIACCPAHKDRTASLSIKEADDGRVLIHCFAGCEPDAILGAVGLEFSHIMPERIGHDVKPQRHVLPAADALRILRLEATVVGIVASDILAHRTIDEATWERLAKAATRIQEIAGWTE